MSSPSASSTNVISFVPLSMVTLASPGTSASTPTAPPTTEYAEHDATTTLFPPMTTPWSKPDSCTWTYDAGQIYQPGDSGPIAWLDLEPRPDATTLSCYPDGMFVEDRTGVFSPGTCPSGWTTVSVQQNTDEIKASATTTAVCCSSEYTLHGDHCYREVPTVLAVPILYNSSGSTYDIIADETSVLVSATLAVHTIQALFQEEDKDVLGLTYEDEILDEKKNNGLTLSERVGIGVGSAIFGLLVIGLGAFLFLRRRAKRSKRQPQHEMDPVDGPMTSRAGDGTTIIQNHRLSLHGGAPTLRNSLADDDSGVSAAYDDDIEALRAQKAAIQRRIEELERVDTNDDIGHRTVSKDA